MRCNIREASSKAKVTRKMGFTSVVVSAIFSGTVPSAFAADRLTNVFQRALLYRSSVLRRLNMRIAVLGAGLKARAKQGSERRPRSMPPRVVSRDARYQTFELHSKRWQQRSRKPSPWCRSDVDRVFAFSAAATCQAETWTCVLLRWARITMEQMTCAHRTQLFGSDRETVTHAGYSMRCRVNDRGRFCWKGRVIDVSFKGCRCAWHDACWRSSRFGRIAEALGYTIMLSGSTGRRLAGVGRSFTAERATLFRIRLASVPHNKSVPFGKCRDRTSRRWRLVCVFGAVAVLIEE